MSDLFDGQPSAEQLGRIMQHLRSPAGSPPPPNRRVAATAPRFTIEQLWEIEDDARSALLNEAGALDNPGHWLGLVIDLSRSLRIHQDHRLNG